MNATEHRKEVFAWFGAAAYHAQCFEIELREIMLLWWRLNNPHAAPPQINAEVDRFASRTIGALLRSIEAAGLLSADAAKHLLAVAKNRNYLMHDWFYVNAACFLTEASRNAAIAELTALSEEFRVADDAASALSRRLQRKMGLTDAAVERFLKEEFAKAESAT